MKFLILIKVLTVVCYVQSANIRVDPLVLTSQGLVRGQQATDGDYSAFLGVPYAHVDFSNPFSDSLPVSEYEGVYNADDGSISCPQIPSSSQTTVVSNDQETLDCLRLNIFVPTQATSRNPLPVLVWIHGGEFSQGKGATSNVVHVVKQDVLVITLNYRLGPYGFMCLDIPSVPGNQGLKDQLTALRWIKQNIAAFGGNPYNITIGGIGAGGASVNYHLYSSQEKLFHKAIIHNNVAQTYGVFVQGDVTVASRISEHLGYNATSTQGSLDFLAKTEPRLVTAAVSELNIQLRPCKELSFSSIDNFIDTYPYDMLNENKIKNTPIIISSGIEYVGSNSNNYFYDVQSTEDAIAKQFDFDQETLEKISSIVEHYYSGDEAIASGETELAKFKSDVFFNHPIQREITKLLEQKAGPIYQAVFDYFGEMSVATNSRDSNNMNFELAAERIGILWGNFIKFGNPTPETNEIIPIDWEQIVDEYRPFLRIAEDLALENRFRQEAMSFWDLFYLSFGRFNKLSRDCKK